jgi:hypothetical protein
VPQTLLIAADEVIEHHLLSTVTMSNLHSSRPFIESQPATRSVSPSRSAA